ncbi:carboxypeptidase S1 [Syncephalastrum racemosum]|uniref:Carboxypeptidase S1 n=1 Tax=Syncephalastrum racemosum TaxID=13706 RepID=A0A1X2HC74_SYNRA|nr:carboxypeptidase S1 [Syncephalastrum racemosum]
MLCVWLLLAGAAIQVLAKSIDDFHSHSFVSKFDASKVLRFEQPKLCDPNVVQYSGYMELGHDEHYFFWFFESQNNPKEAPLTVWLNGGPGCSSMIGLWQELGPCRMNDNGTEPVFNPHSWNQNSNLLFFDQPGGVGFSYGYDNTRTSDEGAVLSYEFLQLFMEAFPQYSQLPFHFFGESFGGHYIPSYAEYIQKQNQAIEAGEGLPGAVSIRLESIGIGNGWTNPLIQYAYSVDMACDPEYGPVLSEDVCQQLKQVAYPRCAEMLKTCYSTGTNEDCVAADDYCGNNLESPYAASGRSPYDIRPGAKDPPNSYIDFLNKPETRQQIGAKTTFKECPTAPYMRFASTGDSARNFQPYVERLLDSGLRVLLYAGDMDYICNWRGNYAWSQKMQSPNVGKYAAQALAPWQAVSREAGQIQRGGLLTFVRIYEAGHEVPYYQPEAALAMFNAWINSTLQ